MKIQDSNGGPAYLIFATNVSHILLTLYIKNGAHGLTFFFFYQNKAPERTQTYRAGYVTCVCPHAFPTRNINRKVIRASILLIFYSGTLESPQHVFRIKLSFRIIFGILKLKFSTIVSTSQWEKMAEKLYKITDLSHISEMTL